LLVTSAARCTLEVRADSLESRLPAEWRLVWCADSNAVQFVAPDSALACSAEIAQVSRVDHPITRADSAANQLTATLCSQAGDPASTAYQIVDLPAGSISRFKVVALQSNDGGTPLVIESNEVTCNDGAVGPYPPILLNGSSAHESINLQVNGMGSDLDAVSD